MSLAFLTEAGKSSANVDLGRRDSGEPIRRLRQASPYRGLFSRDFEEDAGLGVGADVPPISLPFALKIE